MLIRREFHRRVTEQLTITTRRPLRAHRNNAYVLGQDAFLSIHEHKTRQPSRPVMPHAGHHIIPENNPSVKPTLLSMTNNPKKSTNPYQILGLSPSFSISPADIQRAYLARLSAAHPDITASPTTDSLDPATLNTARDTLLDDESRANLILDLIAGPPPSNHTLPDGYLMEMMELRTQIEEELQENPAEARPRWQSWADDRAKETVTEITALFNSLDAAQSDNAEDIKLQIRTHLNAWRYTNRLIEQLDPTYDPVTELQSTKDAPKP